MKRTILTLTMVLASSICSQSFGFDLLDRMLTLNGSGSSASCCETGYEPVCGAEAPCGGCGDCLGEPTCGLEDPCGGCGDCLAEPTCGLEGPCGGCGDCLAEPACGLEDPCGSCDGHFGGGHRGGLLSRLFGSHHGCDSACEPTCGIGAGAPACGCNEPVCGCETVTGCDSHCGGHQGGLLSKLFGHHRDSCCDGGFGDGCCDGYGTGGYGTGGTVVPAPAASDEAAPLPPEPVVDPSANVTSKRHVIQASAVYVR